ncbi:hypothetical protein CsSME_00036247 [Camellia sinensis var. sinensis]
MSSLICKTFHHVRSSVRACSSTYNNLYFIQIHLFSLSSLETTPNQHSFAVNYFINSCGFPLEKALSASNYVKFETPNKPYFVLAFLENHGFTKTQISNLVRKYPPVILCDPEKTLLPKFQFFKSKGVSSTDVSKILSSAPAILKRSMENQIIPSFNFFKIFIQSKEETISTIKRNFKLLLVDLQACALPNVEFLREANVPDAKNLFMLKFMSGAFNSTSDRFRKIVNEVKKLGFNPSKLNFVLAVHALKSMSKSTRERKLRFIRSGVCLRMTLLWLLGSIHGV